MVSYHEGHQLLVLQMRSYLYHEMPLDLGARQVCFVLVFSVDEQHSGSLVDKR